AKQRRKHCQSAVVRIIALFLRAAYLGSNHDTKTLRRAGNTTMSKLDSAMSRFASALDKLEAGVNRQLLRAQSAKGLQGEVERLKEDRAELAEELDQLKSDARRLNELNERASETLADAIEGIREVLA